MTRLRFLVSAWVVIGLIAATLAPVALADKAQPGMDADPGRPPAATVRWTPATVLAHLAPGETVIEHVSFSSSLPIAAASLQVSPSLRPYVTVQPSTPFPVAPNTSYPVDITITLPDVDTAAAGLAGTLHVVSGDRTYLAPLPIAIVRANRAPISWTPERLLFGLDPSNEPETTATATFTSTVNINGARLRVSGPIARFLSVSPEGPFDVAVGPAYQVELTLHAPVAAVAEMSSGLSDASGMEDAWRGLYVSGAVHVADETRTYLDALPVKASIRSLPKTPAIHWRPPAVTLRLQSTHAVSQVVTMTSRITIENALLDISNNIEPYVAIEPALPSTLLPGTVYTFTVSSRMAVVPAPSRLLFGDMKVKDGAGRSYRFPLKVILWWPRMTGALSE